MRRIIPGKRGVNGAGAVVERAEREGATALAVEARPFAETEEPRLAGATWVVVLAGGEGRRLQAWTTLRNGAVIPKQFCRFRDDRTLLAATLDRARRLAPPERTLVVVLESHRDWWEPELAAIPRENVLAQPANRGTAVAILHALVEVHLRDRDPRLVVMPSDHDVEDEGVLLRAIERANRAAGLFPEDVVLLGVEPSQIDCEYGLVVGSSRDEGAGGRVRTFVEKPGPALGARLIRDGALWNSFIFVATGEALYARYEEALPSLVRGYLRGLTVARGDEELMQVLFERLPEHDFSRDLLQRSSANLRLVKVPACGWTDLGTPARLAVWLDHHREASFWRTHLLPWPPGDGGFFGTLQPGGA